MGGFPPEQSQDDTLSSAFDQVMKIIGQMVCPDVALTYSHFAMVTDRLHLVICDTWMEKEHIQLLVLKSCLYEVVRSDRGVATKV